MTDVYKKGECHHCRCKEGELHDRGCDMERCPFCGGQLISCDCCYKLLGYNLDNSAEFCGLPEEVYKKGLPEEDAEKWEDMLEEKGRVPYIRWPVLCAYCGKLWPEFFSVPDAEWEKYIQISERDAVICKKCWDFIVRCCNEGVGSSEPH